MKKGLYLLILAPLWLPAMLFGEQPSSSGRQQNMWQTLMMIGIALVFFYMILWRPEKRRRKKMEQQRNSMQQGDRITAMGIVGILVRIEKETVILKMVDGSQIEVLTATVSDVKQKDHVQDNTESKPQINGS